MNFMEKDGAFRLRPIIIQYGFGPQTPCKQPAFGVSATITGNLIPLAWYAMPVRTPKLTEHSR